MLQHWKEFAYYCNHVADKDPNAGKRFYELGDANYFDLMGAVRRPTFEPHFDVITPFLAKANLEIKELEIVAITPECGYATAYQHYWGTTTDGNSFDYTYRTTSIMRRIGAGDWKYVHEHYSFPCNMTTKAADFTSGADAHGNIGKKGEKSGQ